MPKRRKEASVGDLVVFSICILVILICVMPMLNLLAQSLSSSDAVINGKVSFLPMINRGMESIGEESVSGGADYGNTGSEGEYDYYANTDDEYDYYADTGNVYDYYADTGNEYDYYADSGNEYDYYADSGEDNDYYADSGNDYSSWYNTEETGRLTYKIGTTMESYRYVFMDPAFTRSMWWTAILTVICTIVSLTMTVLCAYPLVFDWLKGKTLINTLIIFTMYFSAGTIPNYILMKSLGLLNNPLVLIIPNCLSVFNMIILRSFFYGIPESLRESAEIDGANPFTILVRIYLPLSLPVLATLALFYAVGRWNGFSDALIYISNAFQQWFPVQLKLWTLIQNQTSIDVTTVEMVAGSVPRASDAMKAAAIMFATVPILVVYPWLQRYFITGVTIGAVKG